MINKDGDYVPSMQCREVMKKHPVTQQKFSIALLKAKSKRMDNKTFDRCMRTIACLQGNRPFK